MIYLRLRIHSDEGGTGGDGCTSTTKKVTMTRTSIYLVVYVPLPRLPGCRCHDVAFVSPSGTSTRKISQTREADRHVVSQADEGSRKDCLWCRHWRRRKKQAAEAAAARAAGDGWPAGVSERKPTLGQLPQHLEVGDANAYKDEFAPAERTVAPESPRGTCVGELLGRWEALMHIESRRCMLLNSRCVGYDWLQEYLSSSESLRAVPVCTTVHRVSCHAQQHRWALSTPDCSTYRGWMSGRSISSHSTSASRNEIFSPCSLLATSMCCPLGESGR